MIHPNEALPRAHDLTAEQLQSLIDTADGDSRCPIYRLVESRIGDRSQYPFEWGAAFWPTFSCFARDYLRYRRFMLMNGIREPVIDLGCNNGFQSELFLTDGYLGVDNSVTAQFNNDHPRVGYAREDARGFPVAGKVVISNMALGFFGEGPLGMEPEHVEELAQARMLFLAAPKSLVDVLIPRFERHRYFEAPLRATAPAGQAKGRRIAVPEATTHRLVLWDGAPDDPVGAA